MGIQYPGSGSYKPVTKQQHLDAYKQKFEEQDLNKDGVVTQQELLASMPETNNPNAGFFQSLAIMHFDSKDTNKDGVVSFEEDQAHAGKVFDTYDENGNGTIQKNQGLFGTPYKDD
ncbi:MAG: hypothetical protein KTR14_05805 [Vampirovibrio sp.]|nr:hypothetical protein [Vampirovibrio sp.]